MSSENTPSHRRIANLVGCFLFLLSACTIDNRSKTPDQQGDAVQADIVSNETSSTNLPPGPLGISLSPSEPTTLDNLEVTLTEEAYDPDLGPEPMTYIYRWTRNGQETLHGGGVLPSQATQRGDVWQVEVVAFDGEREGPPTSAEVTILNAPPAVTPPSLAPVQPTVDDVLQCSGGEASDPDGDSTSMEYAWFVAGELLPDEQDSALLPPHTADVEIRCAARAFDGQTTSDWFGSNGVTPTSIQTQSGMLLALPKALDLGTVLPGEEKQAQLIIRNIGDGPLTLSSATVEGESFSLLTPLPLTLNSEEETTLVLSFVTDKPGLKKGKLLLASNAMNPSAGSIPLLGLGASPCLSLNSYLVDFGGVYPPASLERIVEISSCGALPVVVDGIDLETMNNAPFELDISEGPGPLPWTLEPGKTVNVRVYYSPTSASAVDANGNPLTDKASISFTANTAGSPILVPVQGYASPTGCPVAHIEPLEGNTVLPGSTVTLSAEKSFGVFGQPGKFAWSVASVPEGEAIMPLTPSPSDEVVTYDMQAPGLYEFHLKVFDQTTTDGAPCGAPDAPCTDIIPSCTTAVAVIEAKEAIPLIVELLWDTPGDSDQNDTGPGKGGDLDLHLHNGQGEMPDYDGDGYPDSFFDQAADCFWLDTSPDWGLPGDSNDPMLVLEDADGAGPERIEVHNPAPGSMTVGVHYWSAFDYGPSMPTIRIYHFETLAYEVVGDPMQHADLWEVATITWPGALVSPAFSGNGGTKITPAYPTPF